MPDFIIHLEAVFKRYDVQWILKNLDARFESGNTYAIRGRNGSGKSTLLRLLSAMESPDRGKRSYHYKGEHLDESRVYAHLSFAAPYMNVPGFLTTLELLQFHGKFKEMEFDPVEILKRIDLESVARKPFAQLSSGQKQKVKLALAIYNNDPLLLLDEPGTNLDNKNYDWFAGSLRSRKQSKLIFIATNEERDLELCDNEVNLTIEN